MIFLKYFLLSFLFLLKKDFDIIHIVVFTLIALIFVMFIEIFNKKIINIFISILIFIISLVFKDFRYFILPCLYSIYNRDIKVFPSFLIFLFPFEINFFALSIVISFLAYIEKNLKIKIQIYENEKLKNHILQYELKKDIEKLYLLEEKKVYESVLNERKNISKNLHTSIGHTISSSILQIHSLTLLVNDDKIKSNLMKINENLKNGMKEVREIIHNMYNSSFDIENSIKKYLSSLDAKTEFIYDAKNLSTEFKIDILSIIKEGILNFKKHSNGKFLSIKFLESDKNYILQIFDNGTNIKLSQNGIGLLTIKEICKKYQANINILTESGFKINVVFNKGEKYESFNS